MGIGFYLRNAVRHFITITKHRHTVIGYCRRAGLFWQGLRHDLSKYAPIEFKTGIAFYTGTHSPNAEERRAKGYSEAWLHHKGRNRHHLEYWTDYDPTTGQYAGIEMPLRYVAEMVCDRMAASKTYQGPAYTDQSAYRYYLAGRGVTIIHPRTDALLHDLLKLLSEDGEEALFAHLRALLRQEKEAKRAQKRGKRMHKRAGRGAVPLAGHSSDRRKAVVVSAKTKKRQQ